jgi:hypothetical protein
VTHLGRTGRTRPPRHPARYCARRRPRCSTGAGHGWLDEREVADAWTKIAGAASPTSARPTQRGAQMDRDLTKAGDDPGAEAVLAALLDAQERERPVLAGRAS